MPKWSHFWQFTLLNNIFVVTACISFDTMYSEIQPRKYPLNVTGTLFEFFARLWNLPGTSRPTHYKKTQDALPRELR